MLQPNFFFQNCQLPPRPALKKRNPIHFGRKKTNRPRAPTLPTIGRMRGPVPEVGWETSGTPTSPLLAPRLIPKTLGSHHTSSPPMSWVPALSTAASSGDPVSSPQTLEARAWEKIPWAPPKPTFLVIFRCFYGKLM